MALDHSWPVDFIFKAEKFWDFFASHPKPSATTTIITSTIVPSAPLLTPTPLPFPKDYKQTFVIGEYHLTLTCKGYGEPTIILENGYGEISWDPEGLYRFTHLGRVCTYARPGVNGERVTHLRTVMDQVKDLHDLLTQAGVPGPYILLGYSIAGSHLLLFTDLYPDEVVGLVCVECTTPVFYEKVLEKWGVEQPDDPSWLKDKRKKYQNQFEDGVEKIDSVESAAQVRQVTSLGNRPFVVLIEEDLTPGNSKWSQIEKDVWNETTLGLSKLSSRGRLVIVPNCTYVFPIMTTISVDAALEEVYQAIKGQ